MRLSMPANCFRRVATSSLAGWTTRISRTPCPLLNAGGETRAQTVLAALRNCARAPPPVFRSYVIAITQDEELRRRVLHRNPCNPSAPTAPPHKQNRRTQNPHRQPANQPRPRPERPRSGVPLAVPQRSEDCLSTGPPPAAPTSRVDRPQAKPTPCGCARQASSSTPLSPRPSSRREGR